LSYVPMFQGKLRLNAEMTIINNTT
jgi:hypothetical protein